MSFKLENVVPWGRSANEYLKMFNLSTNEQYRTILDCAGGPSSFNAEMTLSGYNVTSCDPIYQYNASALKSRIRATYPVILEGLKASFERFVWREIASLEQLGQIRLAAMDRFLEDFERGRQEGRYVTDALPELSFRAGTFDLALCSHFLFTYSEQFSLQFHLESIVEMSRVAREVRIFPLVENFTGEVSPHLEPVRQQLIEWGYRVDIERVAYEFQRGGNQRLRISH
ncbi:MAG: SAM-dependent methyltransferase [Cyanobacteriota bacterium]|nr:SAM-dependent methyltransferase [Cyanobacteriota bacterium]